MAEANLTKDQIVDYFVSKMGMFFEKAEEICAMNKAVLERCISDDEEVDNAASLLITSERARIGVFDYRLPESYFETDTEEDWDDDYDDYFEDEDDEYDDWDVDEE